MSNIESSKFEEAMHGIQEARTALSRAQEALSGLEQRLTAEPASFAPLAAATLQLRDHLVTDLEVLEARMAQGAAGPDRGDEAGADRRQDHDPDASLGDRMALGGQ